MNLRNTGEKPENRIDALERKVEKLERLNRDLHYRLRFENLITAISSKFINLPSDSIDAGIDEALREVGEMMSVERTYIFRYDPEAGTVTNTHEWCAPGVEPFQDRLQDIPLEWGSWLAGKITAGDVVHIPRVRDLPPEAAMLKALNVEQGTNSLVLVPLAYGGTITGLLGLDSRNENRTWSDEVISLLKILGEIISSAMERKRAEEALRRSEEKYRTVLETIEEAYWEVDLKGNLVFFNPSLVGLIEYGEEELPGMNYRNYTAPEDLERIRSSFNAVYRTGRGVRLDNYVFVASGGRHRAVEMSTYPVRDGDGNIIGFRGVSRDVTERKQAEQALHESEMRYRVVLEANPDPLVVFDREGRVVYSNPAFSEVFGWSAEELKGRVMEGFIPDDHLDEGRRMAEQMVSGKRFSGIETERFTRSGERIPVGISGAGYRDARGTFMGGIVTLRDIREKKRMEEQLLNIHKLESIGTLAGGIAHDFNNLLMAVQGNVSLALYNLDEEHPHYRLFKNIEKSVTSGSRLTSQLLGFARKGRYEVKPVDVNRLMDDVVKTFGRTRKDIVVHSDPAADLCAVEADEGQLEQMLLNIFMNAGEAMPSGGDLFLATENMVLEESDTNFVELEPGRYVHLSVRDTGVGMDKQTMDHLFEPFFTTREMGHGTGLGMASVYGIVKGHDGHIEAHSLVGAGTTFDIYLPASDKPLQAESAEQQDMMEQGKGTILLVDDEDMVLTVSGQMLERLGYDVLKASCGADALGFCERHREKIDLVILDMVMPGMGGGQMFDRLREKYSGIRVLLSSGYSLEGQAREIMDRGCDGFIQKPFTIQELAARIREVLD
ncbi:MAG: hypothetical protein AVO39_06330 [delta proteobacterium MLS_D]|jgi:two-component system, cell cycle sensor histidine kinase and response regulator CckA|nr:MAG: hypothetical protein AVO39_06330 [delta proteobacterium MLS_D]